MKRVYFRGPCDSRLDPVPSGRDVPGSPSAATYLHLYQQVGGTTFTKAPNGEREDEECLCVLSSELSTRTEAELVLEAYDCGY
jgi:hypothetical protein